MTTALATPRLAPTHCLRCEKRIQERWDPTEAICANCALERELFERESRSA
jgi:hypothetical protein